MYLPLWEKGFTITHFCRDYTQLLEVFGLYFQIRDDYANLQSKEVMENEISLKHNTYFLLSCNKRDLMPTLTQYEDNKSFCEDITEGKFSFPIIHSIRSYVIFFSFEFKTTSLLDIIWLVIKKTCL